MSHLTSITSLSFKWLLLFCSESCSALAYLEQRKKNTNISLFYTPQTKLFIVLLHQPHNSGFPVFLHSHTHLLTFWAVCMVLEGSPDRVPWLKLEVRCRVTGDETWRVSSAGHAEGCGVPSVGLENRWASRPGLGMSVLMNARDGKEDRNLELRQCRFTS